MITTLNGLFTPKRPGGNRCDDRRVIAVGGNDRTTFQFITHGVNWEDCNPNTISELAEEIVKEGWCDVDECLFCRREPVLPPLPPPWGPMDKEGKTWGPCVVRAGVCSCANHELHMKQEFKNYDVDGDGHISNVELKLVMQSCGYRVRLTPPPHPPQEHGFAILTSFGLRQTGGGEQGDW